MLKWHRKIKGSPDQTLDADLLKRILKYRESNKCRCYREESNQKDEIELYTNDITAKMLERITHIRIIKDKFTIL